MANSFSTIFRIQRYAAYIITVVFFKPTVWCKNRVFINFIICHHGKGHHHPRNHSIDFYYSAIFITKKSIFSLISTLTHIQNIFSRLGQFGPYIICHAIGRNTVKFSNNSTFFFFCRTEFNHYFGPPSRVF